MKVVLQERDKKILFFLFRNKVATLYQIKEYLGISASRPRIFNRLKDLCQAGYLEKARFDRRACYGVAEKALEVLLDRDLKKTHPPGLFKLDRKKLKHDLTLCELYHLFENQPHITKLVTHNEIIFNEASEFYKIQIPDALLVINGVAKCAVELELSAKDIPRYRLSLTHYYANEKIKGVLYLVESEFLKRRLLEVDEKIFGFAKRKLFVGDLEPFLKTPTETPVVTSDGKTLRFGEWLGGYNWGLTRGYS